MKDLVRLLAASSISGRYDSIRNRVTESKLLVVHSTVSSPSFYLHHIAKRWIRSDYLLGEYLTNSGKASKRYKVCELVIILQTRAIRANTVTLLMEQSSLKSSEELICAPLLVCTSIFICASLLICAVPSLRAGYRITTCLPMHSE